MQACASLYLSILQLGSNGVMTLVKATKPVESDEALELKKATKETLLINSFLKQELFCCFFYL